MKKRNLNLVFLFKTFAINFLIFGLGSTVFAETLVRHYNVGRNKADLYLSSNMVEVLHFQDGREYVAGCDKMDDETFHKVFNVASAGILLSAEDDNLNKIILDLSGKEIRPSKISWQMLGYRTRVNPVITINCLPSTERALEFARLAKAKNTCKVIAFTPYVTDGQSSMSTRYKTVLNDATISADGLDRWIGSGNGLGTYSKAWKYCQEAETNNQCTCTSPSQPN